MIGARRCVGGCAQACPGTTTCSVGRRTLEGVVEPALAWQDGVQGTQGAVLHHGNLADGGFRYGGLWSRS